MPVAPFHEGRPSLWPAVVEEAPGGAGIAGTVTGAAKQVSTEIQGWPSRPASRQTARIRSISAGSASPALPLDIQPVPQRTVQRIVPRRERSRNARTLATTYFPERLPSQYLRRWRA